MNGTSLTDRYYMLADCNNFFVSCERAFNPSLIGKPVVVLSNNDGCVVSRSNEAKAMGIPMGIPYFKIRHLAESGRVVVFSSNYALYGDMSSRVMSLLSEYTDDLNIYSIDEAFLDVSGMGGGSHLKEYASEIRRRVLKGTGIPITLGIAGTMTLAKVAAHYGKKYRGYGGVCMIENDVQRVKALSGLPAHEVWGIGRRSISKLEYYGIRTALDFTEKSEHFVKVMMGVTGVRTWKELRGIPCVIPDDMDSKKSICTSRSFSGDGLSDIESVEEAVSSFAADSALKLRMQSSYCSSVTFFVAPDRFKNTSGASAIQSTSAFAVPTNDTSEIVHTVLSMFRRKIPRFKVKRAGVILWDISPDGCRQMEMFDNIDRSRQAVLQAVIDDINMKNGKNAVRLAVQGEDRMKYVQREHLSRQYTTKFGDILEIK